MNFYKQKNNEKIYGGLALVVIATFAAFKIRDLFLPYFWDELGVYSRASLYLTEHGLSLLPSSIPSILSRGHPLLFQFIYALGFTAFGKGVVVGHSISLLVACVLLALVYQKISLFYNRLIGFCATLLLCVQPVFIAQSTFILPEMMLGLFAFLALTSYYEKQLAWFAFYASLAIMIKESAIVIPFVAFTYGFIQHVIFKRETEHFKLRSLLLTFSSLAVFGIFLVIQRVQNGWFFFPEHVGYISFSVDRMLEHNHNAQKFLFFHQGRYWWVKILVLGGIVSVLKSRIKFSNSFVLLSSIFICACIAFGAINFYMDRYLLAAFPFLVTIVVVAAYIIFSNKVWLVSVVVALSVLCLRDIDPARFNYDCDMSFKHHLNVEQKLIDRLCEIATPKNEVSGNFPIYFALLEKNTGFTVCPQIKYVNGNFCKKEYLVYTSENGYIYPESDNCKLIFHIKESYVDGMIYEKTN